jgi:hypothetical protein
MKRTAIPFVIVAVAVIVTGCASQGGTPAASQGSPQAAAAASASAPPSCKAQIASWRSGGGSADVTAVVNDDAKLISAAKSLLTATDDNGSMSGPESGMQTAAANLQADAQSAEADPPPSCVPGLSNAWRAGMTNYAKASLKYQDGVSELSSGQNSTAIADFEAGNTSAYAGKAGLADAAKDINPYNS